MTPKQTRFTAEYLANGFNATRAAISAGYSKKTAASIGEENLRKPEISAAIEVRTKEIMDRLEVTADLVVQEIAKMAFFDPFLRRAAKTMRRLPNRLTSGFQLHHQISDFGVRFPCYSGSIQGYYFIGRPSHRATAQTHWFGKEPLRDAQVDHPPPEPTISHFLTQTKTEAL